MPVKYYSTLLYDAAGKPVGEAPDSPEELKKIFQTGQYGFLKGQRLNWRAPDGSLASFEATGDKVKELLDAGYQLETTGQREARIREEEYGGMAGEVKSFLHGVGNTLTFGGMDVLGEAAMGESYVREVRETKEASPTANLAGNITGVIAPFLLPGGQGKALAGLGKMGAGVRGVAKLGRATEQFVLKGLGGPKGGIIRQALAKGTALGAGAGVEGSIYGAGQFMSEQALGETEATAENLLSYMGTGVMWGGIAGGGMGAGGTIIKRGLGGGINYARRAKGSIVKMYEKARGVKAAEGLEDEIGKLLDQPAKPGFISRLKAKLVGTKPEYFETFKDPDNLRIAQEADDIVNDITKRYSKTRDEFMDLAEKAQAEGRKIEEFKNIGSMLKEADAITVETNNLGLLEKANDELQVALTRGKEIYGQPGAITDIKALVVDAMDEIKSISSAGKPEAVLRVNFSKAYKLKRTIQHRLARLSRMTNKDDAFWKTFEALENIETRLRLSLENPKIYGPTVAGAVERNNVGWVKKLSKIRTKAGRAFDEHVADEKFAKVYKTDRGAVKKTINNFKMPGNESYEDYLKEHIRNEMELVETMGDTLKLGKDHAVIVDRMRALETDMGDILKQAEKTVGVRNQLTDIVTKSNQFSSLLPAGIAGAGIGYALGGTEGAAIGLGLSMFTNPGKFLNLGAALHRLSSDQSLSIAKGIKSYVRKATGKAAKLKKPARAMIAPTSLKILQDSNWGEKRTKDKTRHQAFERRTKELTEFLSNPQKAVDRITRNTGDVSEVAPNVATAMQVKAVKAARYLYDKAPKPRDRGVLLSGKWKPPDHELAKFERIAAVVNGGADVILKNLEAGILTVPEVEAFRENWPKQYEQVAMTLIEQIPEMQDKLPYKERVQLQILFPEVKVEPTMEAGFRQAIAMIDMVPPVAPGETPGQKQPKSKVATGDYDKLSVDTASMTDSQRVEMNKLS